MRNDILEEMGAWRSDNYYVTDNGSNVKAAFKDQIWILCCGHNLKLVLVHGLEVKDPPASVLEIISLIGTCKEIVTHIKRSKIQHELQTSVKQSVSTRWNSQLTMLQSVLTNFEDITTLSAREQDKKLQRKLFDLNETLLKDVITVLTPFDTATKHLSTDKECSLHMVVATKYQIKKYLQVSAIDSNIIKDFKTHLNDMMKRYFPINEMHRTETHLNPKFKRIPTKIMTEEEIKEALNSLNIW